MWTSARTTSQPGRVEVLPRREPGQQSGTLGWELWLTNQAPGTEIALRQNALPFRRNYRTDGSPYVDRPATSISPASKAGSSNRGTRWISGYVGVYSPDEPLGAFTLHTAELTRQCWRWMAAP